MVKTSSEDNLLKLLAQLWGHLSGRRRRQFVLLTVLMLLSALAEILSLGAVLPFIGILTTPEIVSSSPVALSILQPLGISASDQLVLLLTAAFCIAALGAGACRILLLWASTRLAFLTGSDLSIDTYRRTLYQPYCVHIARNSSEVISGVSNKVYSVVYGILQPLTVFLSAVVLFIAVTSALIIINPSIAFFVLLTFGLSYLLLTWVARSSLRKNSELIARKEVQVIKALQEGLGGIREVLLDNAQSVYCEVYRQADYPLRRAQGNNVFISQSPRYVMEALAMVAIALLAYTLSVKEDGLTSALPILGALALGAQRMVPALQHGYGAWSTIMGNRDSLVVILELLDQPMPARLLSDADQIRFRDGIRVERVRYRHSVEGGWVLNGIDLEIVKGTRIGIVGTTGSGKSTLLDVIMGLLIPSEGKILVDGEEINESRRVSWRNTIAHVPQNIYLTDASFAENIAFGVSRKDIDIPRLQQAAQQANLAEFIEECPEGYNTMIGERGIRLSGGQRQRIGIARALYKRASVLIFDEATSALDTATEQSVMNAIYRLDRNLTLVMVAHRLSTVRHCDSIFQLENGKIVARGSYDHLLTYSPSFRSMVGEVL